MPLNSSTGPSPQARAEAAEWLVALRERDGDESTRREFHAWVRKSPENVHAFLRMTAVWEDTGALKSSTAFDLDGLLKQASDSGNVVELDLATAPPVAPTPSVPVRRRPHVGFAIAASTLLLLVALAWLEFRRDIYVTDTGEQRTIALADGSAVVLNANSRMRVRFSAAERNIDLIQGQAIFRVAHNPARPFVVHSGSTDIRAVGTQFDVYRQERGTIVTVLEGAVAVRKQQQADGPAPVLVTAGEQISVSPRSLGTPHSTDTAVATAWSQGKLIFHETPLSEVVAEFNRYSSRRLIIEDRELQQFHLSGVFPSSDPSRVAELLQQRFGATVVQSDNEIRVSR
ncbi:MAG: FecR family protein [Proteobacteria bacterium]|nr:FecR family protein [Pseudomonadota bacterium]